MNKAKVVPEVVQTILRHSRIQTTPEIAPKGDGDETRAAHFLKELEIGVAVAMTSS